MLRNYFKIALRNLSRQKILAFINVFGLSTGIAFFILLLLYSVNELSFDRFHKNERNIYCVYDVAKGLDGSSQYSASVAMPLGPTIRKDMPDVINYVRLKQLPVESYLRTNNELRGVTLSFADPQFFSVFTFPLKYGNASSALKGLNNLVITASKAKELFGTDNVVGKTVQLKIFDDFQPFIISAVAEDMSANSSIRFDVMGSFAFFETTKFGMMFNNWYTTAFRTFVQLRAGSSLPGDINRLAAFHHAYNEDDATITKKTKSLVTYGLLPLRSIHTDTRINDITDTETVDPKTIWIILGIAAAILLIACINFTTLAIGRSAGRGKEVGVRKVIGAERSQLVFQFLSEAILLSTLSTIIGLLLAKLLLPYFNQLAGRNLQLSFSLYPEMGWLIIGILVLVAILSGSYPALLLSKFKPIEVLKNKIRLGGSNLFTRSLVTLQFILSIGLIVSTIVILQQTKYLTSKNPGFNKENVVMIDAEQTNSIKDYPLFKQALSANTNIIDVASSETGLGEGAEFQNHGFMYNGTHKAIYEYLIDPDYINVLGMQLIAGRNFNAAMADDTVTSVIINEAMMNEFGWTLNNVIGQQVKGYTNTKTPVVIGVVKNFNFQSLTEKIQPQLFHQFAGHGIQKFFARIKSGDPSPVIAAMQKTWSSIVPDVPFKYSFLDDDLDNFYKSEKRWGSIVAWAGAVAIFLACLGLFGLAALAAVNRVKEIGIRKVMGASMGNIVTLLSKEFLKLIIIALIIASPAAWYFMNEWLQGFAYRIHITVWIFFAAGIATILIALLTISFQAIKAAIANPVKSLRTE